MVKCDHKNKHPLPFRRLVSTSTPHPKVWKRVTWCGSSGAGWRSLARGHGGLRGASLALVPLAGVLLTVHQIADAKVASHLEVKTAICASVALWMAEAVVSYAHGQCAAKRRNTGASDGNPNAHSDLEKLAPIKPTVTLVTRRHRHLHVCVLMTLS